MEPRLESEKQFFLFTGLLCDCWRIFSYSAQEESPIIKQRKMKLLFKGLEMSLIYEM